MLAEGLMELHVPGCKRTELLKWLCLLNRPNGNHLSEQRLEAAYGLCGAHFDGDAKRRFLETRTRAVGNVKRKARDEFDS